MREHLKNNSDLKHLRKHQTLSIDILSTATRSHKHLNGNKHFLLLCKTGLMCTTQSM